MCIFSLSANTVIFIYMILQLNLTVFPAVQIITTLLQLTTFKTALIWRFSFTNSIF